MRRRHETATVTGTLVAAVRRANRPGPPEHSMRLRIATTGAVLSAIAACHLEHELSTVVAAATMGSVTAGMVFSAATRSRPQNWVKPLLAVAVVAAFGWFFLRLTSQPVGDISQVEAPLAVLFAWIQVTHAFDVPSRRDLAFSLVGSASLMAVAAAQAIDSSFGLAVAVWLGFGLWGLVELWRSASGGGRIGAAGLSAALGAVAVVAVVALALLPAPQTPGNVAFPASAGAADNPLGGHGTPPLSGDAAPAEPARAGTPGGPSRVGGYLGFAKHLDTALRGTLGTQVVMRVRAQRPSYWLGETFDTWNGQSWGTTGRKLRELPGGPPFTVGPGSPARPGPPDLQTFYLSAYGPNLVFHAPDAREVWFPASRLYAGVDGTLVAPITMGPGTIYTVASVDDRASPQQMQALGDLLPVHGTVDTQLPRRYRRVQQLAEKVTADQATTYDKVEALIGWIGGHTRYSTAIPPLPPGADAVDEFLFGNRIGFCEQISTALAVMLRSIGIPAREAVGYVPGPFNPVTDLYEVQARDAHAWVQVHFPGLGWQSFDPTAVVPLANPSPGAVLAHDAAGALQAVPWAPTGGALVVAAAGLVAVRHRRRRPPSWEAKVARRLERSGARRGHPRRPGETLAGYAAALEALGASPPGQAAAIADTVEASVYGAVPVDARRRQQLRRQARVHVPAAAGRHRR